ncbi:MAG: SpvB/TcaC N-terminal domain-containing protein [Myxococcota bacterium]|nr:SpvB/TcaC N-terminal domain-containing protein [Myxococcota bacterium]
MYSSKQKQKYCFAHRFISIVLVWMIFLCGPGSPTTHAAPTPTLLSSNSVAGIQTPDPLAGIDLIEPPTAQGHGSAQLIYPLRVPPGRNGMAPDLALVYDSDRGNGWMGMGWGIDLSSIEVDTRFGVPKYDGDEIYLLDGMMLTPAEPDAFHPPGCTRYRLRVEGSFDRILRCGSSSENYYWVVTDKGGTRYTYGRGAGARLASPLSGDIFSWHIETEQDTHGNRIAYAYALDEYFTENETFTQLYPHRIDYTAHVDNAGVVDHSASYHIEFIFKGGKEDSFSNGRPGFLTLTRQQLKGIDIKYESNVIRSYIFDYELGAFDKNLLKSVTLLGADRGGRQEVFYSHGFDYFDAPEFSKALAEPATWGQLEEEGLLAEFGLGDGLGSSTYQTGGGGASVGVGMGPASATVGGNGFGGDDTTNTAPNDFLGNGLLDVGKDTGTVAFNSLLAQTGNRFSDPTEMARLDFLGHNVSFGGGGEFSMDFGGSVSAGGDFTQTDDDKLMADMNGDGFVDLVRKGNGDMAVYQNNGRGGFEEPMPWTEASAADLDFQNHFVNGGTPVEAILHWTAAFDGTIDFSAPISKLATGGDGVDAHIYHQRGISLSLVQSEPISASDTSEHLLSFTEKSVAAGDQLFMVLDGRSNTDNDAVRWTHDITYKTYQDVYSGALDSVTLEPYGAKVGNFAYPEDFRPIGIGIPWMAHTSGQVHIKGPLQKASTADEVSIQVLSCKLGPDCNNVGAWHVVTTRSLPSAAINEPIDMGTFNVNRGDFLMLRMISELPIDPGRIEWAPTITYTLYNILNLLTRQETPYEVDCPQGIPLSERCHLHGGANSYFVPRDEVEFVPDVHYARFDWKSTLPTQNVVLDQSGTLPVKLEITRTILGIDVGWMCPYTLTVQGINELHERISVDADYHETLEENLYLPQDEPLFFTAVMEPTCSVDPAIFDWVLTVDEEVVPINVRVKTDSVPSKGGFHHWIAWDRESTSSFDGYFGMDTPTDLSPMRPVHLETESLWLGNSGARISPSYWMPGNTGDVVRVSEAGSAQGGALNNLRTSHTWNVEVSAGAGPIEVGIGYGESTTELDLFDVDGDERPDSVTPGGIRRNTGSGFEASDGQSLPFGPVRKSRQVMGRFGFNTGKMLSRTDTRGKVKSIISTEFGAGVTYAISPTTIDFVDINGDGLLDHIKQDLGDSSVNVRFNLGHRFSESVNWTNPSWADWKPAAPEDIRPEEEIDSDAPSVEDLVADVLKEINEKLGTTDVLRFQDTTTFNIGAGGTVSGNGGGAGISYSIARTLVDLIDINGDGLPDQIQKAASGDFFVKLNTGTGFLPPEPWYGLPDWEGSGLQPGKNNSLGYEVSGGFSGSASFQVCFFVCVGGSSFYSRGKGANHMMLEDINGDGLPDHVLRQENDVQVKLNRLGKANLLKAVSRPLGGSFELDYTLEGNYVDLDNHIDMPYSHYVLSSVAVEDGQPSTAPYVHHFEYTEQAGNTLASGAYYDRKERTDYGYEKVTVHREDDSFVRTLYHNQDYYRQGLAHTLEEGDAQGDLFNRISTTYDTPPPPETGFGPGSVWFFPKETASVASYYEGWYGPAPGSDVGKHTTTSQDWDAQGNVTRIVREVDQGPEDDVISEFDYSIIDDNNTYLTLLTQTRTLDHLGSPISQQTNAYYPTGALEQTTAWVRGGIDPSTGQPYQGADETNLRTHFDYDAFGNPIELTDPTGYTLSYDYDDVTYTYATQVSDSLGYTSFSTPNYFFGTQAHMVDVNGNSVTFELDDFGRPSRVFGPNDGAGDPLLAFEYSQGSGSPAVVPWARLDRKDVAHPGDPITTVVFVDGLGRVIQTKQDLEKDMGSSTEVGMAVSGKIEFDERGRVQRSGHPVFDTGALPTEFVGVSLIHPTEVEYDILGRVTKTYQPTDAAINDPTITHAITETKYGFEELDGVWRMHTQVTDPEGKLSDAFSNVDGATLAVKKRNDIQGVQTELVTRYDYRPDGLLERVIDAKGNVTQAVYDSLSRLVSLDNGDTGRTEWRFNTSGNLSQKQTAGLRSQGRSIQYHYTPFSSRLEYIAYPDAYDNDVELIYGQPEEAGFMFGNIAARLKQENSEAGSRGFEYDALGNTSNMWMQFEPLHQPKHGFPEMAVGYDYDDFGRMMEIFFPGPGAEKVSYRYDFGGNVNRVVGADTDTTGLHKKRPNTTEYLRHQGYDEFGQVVRRLQGNAIETTFAYKEKTRRLAGINADHAVSRPCNVSVRPFQRMRYDYDLVGNMVALTNDIDYTVCEPHDHLGGYVHQTFEYDDLDQLVYARGDYQNNSHRAERTCVAFEYDEISNIVTKEQVGFTDQLGNGVDEIPPGQCWPKKKQDYPSPKHPETYRLVYEYGTRPHAPVVVSEASMNSNKKWPRDFIYDASGNQLGWESKPNPRTILRDADGRIKEIYRNGHTVSKMLYTADGQRAVHLHWGNGKTETVYYGPNLAVRDDKYLTKHIFVNGTRIASKMDSGEKKIPKLHYYHQDHLGGTAYVSDEDQDLIQWQEYFPTGELFEDENDHPFNVMPYLFTDKELDRGSDLYYHGARYYDPHLSQWTRPDPILASYMQGAPNSGVYDPINLGLYTYVGNNPVNYVDPGGLWKVEDLEDMHKLAEFQKEFGGGTQGTLALLRTTSGGYYMIEQETNTKILNAANEMGITYIKQGRRTGYHAEVRSIDWLIESANELKINTKGTQIWVSKEICLDCYNALKEYGFEVKTASNKKQYKNWLAPQGKQRARVKGGGKYYGRSSEVDRLRSSKFEDRYHTVTRGRSRSRRDSQSRETSRDWYDSESDLNSKSKYRKRSRSRYTRDRRNRR